MKYVLLDNVKQGERLGRSILSSDGRVMLEEGVALSIGLISRLRRMGVSAIYLEDDRLKDINTEEVLSDATKRETIEQLANCIQYIQDGKKDFDMRAVSKTTGKIIDEILLNRAVLLSLSDIRTTDNQLFIHSTNVCIMSILMGIKLGLKRSELNELATGALFHDVGKTLGSEYKNKDSDDEKSDHTWKGFNFLRQKHEFSMLIAHVAFQHHEQVNGGGFPRGVTGDHILLYSKIVAVANYYDNLVSSTLGQHALQPNEACERILGLTNVFFDHKVVWEFLRSIAFYPTGRQVKLSTGQNGIIVGQNYGLPQRPIVRIYHQDNKSKYESFDFKEIDLGKETTVFIKDVL